MLIASTTDASKIRANFRGFLHDQARATATIETERGESTAFGKSFTSLIASREFRSLQGGFGSDAEDRELFLGSRWLFGFYVREAFEFNGFAPNGILVFFVADEPTVLYERVSSHETGHILGLAHARSDPSRLMFSGTNGIILTGAEQRRARATALEILNDAL